MVCEVKIKLGEYISQQYELKRNEKGACILKYNADPSFFWNESKYMPVL